MFIFSFFPETSKTDNEQFKNSMKEKEQLRNSNDLTKGGSSVLTLAYLSLCFIINFPPDTNNSIIMLD